MARQAKAMPAGSPVISFDGPSGSGKGTLSRAVAVKLGWHLLDSGALYRLVALCAQRRGLDPEREQDMADAAQLAGTMEIEFRVGKAGQAHQTLLFGEDVSTAIRSEEIGNLASYFAVSPGVRAELLLLQRKFRQPPGLVADGRDMGTVVFQDAALKIYVTASAQERAKRRYTQLLEAGVGAKIDRIYCEILARDERDEARTHSPLKPAEDAVVIDTTDLDIDETLARINNLLLQKGLATH